MIELEDGRWICSPKKGSQNDAGSTAQHEIHTHDWRFGTLTLSIWQFWCEDKSSLNMGHLSSKEGKKLSWFQPYQCHTDRTAAQEISSLIAARHFDNDQFTEEVNNNCFWHINHSIQRIIASYIHSIKALNWKLTSRALCEKSFSCQSDALSFLLLTHKCNPSVPLRYLVHNTSVLCYNVQHCLQPINFSCYKYNVESERCNYKI